jgi:hypothetical protein
MFADIDHDKRHEASRDPGVGELVQCQGQNERDQGDEDRQKIDLHASIVPYSLAR